MCALFGWLDCGKKLPHKLLKKLTQALANAAEERGTDAAGISYVKNGHVTIYKRPKPAHKIKFNIPENTVAVMVYIYSSTKSIMDKALKTVGLQNFPCTEIKTIHGDIIKIDNNGFLSRSDFEAKEDYRYASWCRCFYDYDDDYYSQHEQLLLEMCSCYGVDENDVILLLDYGYTADEIEDMLCDYSLIHDTIKAVKGEEDYSDFLLSI